MGTRRKKAHRTNALEAVWQLDSSGSVALARRFIVTGWFSFVFLFVTDLTAHAGVNEWTSNGPGGGVLTSLAVDPRNPEMLYAGTYGAIFKTTDGGERWNWLDTQNLIGGGTYVSALVFDPQQAGTLYAVVVGGTLLKSTDGGNTWATLFQFGFDVRTLVIDLLDSNVLYAGGMKSTDGGANWESLFGAVNALVIDPQSCSAAAGSCSTLYAGTDAGVYKSTDRGVTWFSASTGLPAGVKTLVLDPQSPATLYAFYAYDFYKSTDGGGHWTVMNVGTPSALALDPTTVPSTAYLATGSEIMKSSDGFTTWSLIDNTGFPPVFGYISTLAVAHPSQQPATLYAVNFYGYGIYKRRDDETRWTAKNAGLSALTVADVVIDHPAGQALPTLYAGTTTLDLFKGPNGGETWETTNFGFGPYGVQILTNDPRYPSTLYAVQGPSQPVRKSADGGATWEDLGSFPEIVDLAVDPQNSDLYISASSLYAPYGGVYKRASNGTTWEPKNTGLPPSSSNSFIPASPYLVAITRSSPDVNAPATLYAATESGLYKSINGGDSWTLLNEQIFPALLVIDPHVPNTLYTLYAVYEDGGNFGLHKSTDGGATWTFISSGPPGALGAIRSLAVDPNVPTTLYAGISVLGSNMFRSTDGGLHWTDISLNLPNTEVYSIVVDPRDSSSIYIGTGLSYIGLGGGVYALQLANDLVVSKTGPANSTNAPFTYTISVRNNGPFDATNVTVNDPLPAGLSLISATPSQGTCSGTVTCQLGVLALNATATVTVVVQPTEGGTFTNTVTVTAAEADASPINNTARTTTTIDFDGDGHIPPGDDCNDHDAAIHPGATEICNNVDDNCDGHIDEGLLSTFYRDADGDGFGSTATATSACSAPAGYVPAAGDCNDTKSNHTRLAQRRTF